MQLGFSYIGVLFLLLLFVPNLFWTKNKPSGYEQSTEDENRLLLVLERTGEILVTCMAPIFSDFNFYSLSLWSLWLAAAFLCMILYEIWWIRYFRSRKTLADFYSSLCGIPVAGAVLPVLAFLLLGIYDKNPILIGTDVMLGIGHIGIHLQHLKKCRQIPPEQTNT